MLSADPSASAGPPSASSAEQDAWRGFHLVYHGDRDRLLRALVAPVARGLLARGEIETFFFIRYDLGGPHVRLRVRPRAECGDAAAAQVRQAAADFFARHPSPQLLPEEKVRRENRTIIPWDPHATDADDVVFADGSVHEAPVRLEVERYGGPALLPGALDAFALSSLDVLAFLDEAGDGARAARPSEAGRALVRQAWGLVHAPGELAQLVGYAARPQAEALQRFVAMGDEAWDRRREALRALVREELAVLSGLEGEGADPPPYAEAARRLGWEIRDLDAGARGRIASAHVHMTANRLGLRNPEETYVGRMMERAVRDLAEMEPAFWREAWDARRAVPDPPPLADQARAALGRFAAGA